MKGDESLAKTRDKRSHRIPARFDDFGEVPTRKIFFKGTDSNNSSNSSLTPPPPPHPSSSSSEEIVSDVKDTNKDSPPSATFATPTPTPTPTPTAPPTEETTAKENVVAVPIKDVKKESPTSPEPATPTPTPTAPPTEETTAKENVVVPIKDANNDSKRVQADDLKTSIKKFKGSSLMVKPTVQQNNGFPRVQYGPTRLLLNEPLYLPKSVGTIAPITTTMQKMNNQFRKAPFLSKKADICLKYQSSHMGMMLNSNMALQRIVHYLPITDRLNLRSTCKAWRRIVDNDCLWKRIHLTGVVVTNWAKFGKEIVYKHRTEEIIFEGMPSSMLTENRWAQFVDCFRYMTSVEKLVFVDPLPLKTYIQVGECGLKVDILATNVVDDEDTLDELESEMISSKRLTSRRTDIIS